MDAIQKASEREQDIVQSKITMLKTKIDFKYFYVIIKVCQIDRTPFTSAYSQCTSCVCVYIDACPKLPDTIL